MRINFGIFRDCKRQHLQDSPSSACTLQSTSFNLHEEYASAFRTESYTDFLASILDITLAHGAALRPHSSSSASFRLLSHHLLDPDQPTVTRLLSLPLASSSLSLLPDFFTLTADASLLCSLLLKDLHFLRLAYRPLLKSLSISLPASPFSSLPHLHAIQTASAVLLQSLERRRAKARTKLRRIAVMAQLDAAAKGTYILNRDLDTISSLVARVRNEVEHVAALLSLCRGREGRGEGGRRMAVEVARQIRRNDEGFRQQMDELEEHLYLCLMTINKTRSLMMKEVIVATGAKL